MSEGKKGADDDLMAADALASAVAQAKSQQREAVESTVAQQDRRRRAGPLSVKASVEDREKGAVLTLRNMFWAFHHPQNGGQYSSSIYISSPSVLAFFVVGALVGAATWFALAGLVDLTPQIITTFVVTLIALLGERFYAHRRLDVQVTGGNFALYRNGSSKPFVIGPKSDLKLGTYGTENYRRVRFLFPLKSIMSGTVEHDIYLQPVPSDCADIVQGFAERMGIEG